MKKTETKNVLERLVLLIEIRGSHLGKSKSDL